jgi:hypothetical protein
MPTRLTKLSVLTPFHQSTAVAAAQAATCDDVLPISAPGLKFQCPEETTQYDPNQNKITPPMEKHCCMVRGSQSLKQLNIGPSHSSFCTMLKKLAYASGGPNHRSLHTASVTLNTTVEVHT